MNLIPASLFIVRLDINEIHLLLWSHNMKKKIQVSKLISIINTLQTNPNSSAKIYEIKNKNVVNE